MARLATELDHIAHPRVCATLDFSHGYLELANQPGDLESATRDINRYIVMPGQATAYMIGQMEILRLRADAQRRLGSRYDIKKFHDIVLGSGFVPLDILKELVEAWV